MENYDNQIIYYYNPVGYSCNIFVSGGGTEPLVVPKSLLNWDVEEYEDGFHERFLTLNEILVQLQNLGYTGVYYVLECKPLDGNIYYYGNYKDCKRWLKYGSVVGYA